MRAEILQNSVYVEHEHGCNYILLGAIEGWTESDNTALIHWGGSKVTTVSFETSEASEEFLEHLASVLGAWPRVGSE